MNQPINPDDGLEDELRGLFNRARDGAMRARQMRFRARQRSGRAHDRLNSTTAKSTRKDAQQESVMRLAAALEARHYASELDRDFRSAEPTHTRSPEDIRREATAQREPGQERIPALKVADAHVDAYRERAIEVGISAAVVDDMISGYDLERAEDLTAADRSNEHALDVERQAAAVGDDAFSLPIAYSQPTSPEYLAQIDGYYGENVDLIDRFTDDAARDKSIPELIADSRLGGADSVKVAEGGRNEVGVVDLDAVRALDLDGGVER